jgi:hypothetical protein
MTQNNTQWGENVTHEATGDIKQDLCSDAWIHAYTHPLLAVFMNPVHARIKNPILWEGKGEGEAKFESEKCGFRKFTTLRQIPLPEVTDVQKITFGILCVKEVYKDPSWNQWADKWLSGEDRTEASAANAYYAANAANAAAYAAANAARAAANAEYVANAAADAARAAARAAAAYYASAASNASKGKELDFVSIALKAVKEL